MCQDERFTNLDRDFREASEKVTKETEWCVGASLLGEGRLGVERLARYVQRH